MAQRPVSVPRRSESSRAGVVANGADILDAVQAYLRRFIVYPSEHALMAHTLWVAHTHRIDFWDSTLRIAFMSPEAGSGKSRALEVSEPLVPRAVLVSNISPAYLFRRIADAEGPPTLLLDEVDRCSARTRTCTKTCAG